MIFESIVRNVIIIYKNIYVFFLNDTATTEIYTLSLHDALPIWAGGVVLGWCGDRGDRLGLAVLGVVAAGAGAGGLQIGRAHV